MQGHKGEGTEEAPIRSPGRGASRQRLLWPATASHPTRDANAVRSEVLPRGAAAVHAASVLGFMAI